MSFQLAYGLWLIAHGSYVPTICHRPSAYAKYTRLATALFDRSKKKRNAYGTTRKDPTGTKKSM